MVKVKVRTGRGTGTIEVDVGDLKFSGEEFKKIQAERKKAAGSRTVSTGRVLVEESFQIHQNQNLDLQLKAKQEVLAEVLVQEKAQHKLLFGFYFSYIFQRYLISQYQDFFV